MKIRILNQSSALCLLVLLQLASLAAAATHRVERVSEPVPSDKVSPEIAGKLSAEGFRVIRGTSRIVCEIWLCQDWPVKQIKPTGDLIYPFRPGQLIGVVHYPRKAADFRDQDIQEGIYTLRFSAQPVDGDHVGTSPTRDFLALSSAAQDKSPEDLDYKSLVKASASVAGASHPAILSLQRPQGDDPIRHEEEKDWWVVRLMGKAKVGESNADLPLDLVVAGVAAE